VGKPVTVTVGGKVDRFHGDPVEISGRVRLIHDGIFSASTRFNAGTFHRGHRGRRLRRNDISSVHL
jgi:hypothetical protein